LLIKLKPQNAPQHEMYFPPLIGSLVIFDLHDVYIFFNCLATPTYVTFWRSFCTASWV